MPTGPPGKPPDLFLLSHSILSNCDPTDCSPPGSSVLGIFQARLLEWVAISSSGGSSRPRDRTQVFCIAGRFFPAEPAGPDLFASLQIWVQGEGGTALLAGGSFPSWPLEAPSRDEAAYPLTCPCHPQGSPEGGPRTGGGRARRQTKGGRNERKREKAGKRGNHGTEGAQMPSAQQCPGHRAPQVQDCPFRITKRF